MRADAAGNGWLQSGIVEVLLPSGAQVRLVRPSLRHLIRYGILPSRLHEPALRAADKDWLTEAGHQDERQVLIGEFMSFLVATSIRAVRDGDEWVPVRMDPDAVPDVDQADLDALEDIVLRDRTPAEVTARSRRLLGLPPDDEPDEEVSVSALEDFRGEPGGAEGGADSEPVGAAPLPDAGTGG
jgi:hypothetical protein